MSATPDGGLLVTGSLAGRADLGGGPIGDPSGRSVTGFVALFDRAGELVFTRALPHARQLPMVALDPSGGLYLAGLTGAEWEPWLGRAAASDRGERLVVRLDAGGSLLWARRFEVAGLCAFGAGHAAIAGAATGWLDLGAGAMPDNGGRADVFIAKIAL